MSDAYDLVIIGGGSGGLTAASLAVQLETRVAIVERHRIGGDCTWTGCVPSKTLLRTAKLAHQMRHADRHGLAPVDQEVDLSAVMAHVHDVIADVYEEESPDALRDEGIDVYLDAARFLDPHTVAVGETALTFRHALIATGAHPFIPPIEGLGD
ncbi:MAG: FAD-dependent oxidoreductase, partial [Anaerolineae bacterium]